MSKRDSIIIYIMNQYYDGANTIIRKMIKLEIFKKKGFLAFAILALFVCLDVQAQNLFISSHYDIARETPIFGTNYSYPVSEKVHVVGFAEMWYNPEGYAYPENSWPVFSKHWVTYGLTSRFSLSMELEISRNLPGAWSRSSILSSYSFEPDRWHAQPKIGASFRLL